MVKETSIQKQEVLTYDIKGGNRAFFGVRIYA